MASQAQLNTNRRNAAKSSGPKAVEGKQIVSRNAITHGLLSLSDDGIFLDEDPTAFAQLSENLRYQYNPLGEIEKSLVDGIVWTLWRLRRLPRADTGWHPIRRYGHSSEGFVGYDDKRFRDGVTKATQDQHAAVLAAAPTEDRAALQREIQQKAERNIQTGLFARLVPRRSPNAEPLRSETGPPAPETSRRTRNTTDGQTSRTVHPELS